MALNPFEKRLRNRLLGSLAGRYIRFVERTSTLVPGSDDGDAVMAANHPAIIAMWHGEFMLVAPLAPKGFDIANMVALHGDAELIGRALETFDMALVRGYSRELRIACDELHDDPFNPIARQELIRLILQDSKSADAAKERLYAVLGA